MSEVYGPLEWDPDIHQDISFPPNHNWIFLSEGIRYAICLDCKCKIIWVGGSKQCAGWRLGRTDGDTTKILDVIDRTEIYLKIYDNLPSPFMISSREIPSTCDEYIMDEALI